MMDFKLRMLDSRLDAILQAAEHREGVITALNSTILYHTFPDDKSESIIGQDNLKIRITAQGACTISHRDKHIMNGTLNTNATERAIEAADVLISMYKGIYNISFDESDNTFTINNRTPNHKRDLHGTYTWKDT